jgi:hypothetical protein
VTKVVADEREISFLGFYLFDFADAFDALWLVYVAAKRVHRIGGTNNNTTITQAFHYLFQVSFVGIIRMNSQ